MEAIANIPLHKGKFEVYQDGARTVGYLTLGTSIGLVRTQCEMSQPLHMDETGNTQTELEIPAFSFAAAALNDVLQDAISSGVQYAATIGRFESSDTHAAFHTIFKSALGDLDSRQYMADLVALYNAPSNIAFTNIQQDIFARMAQASSSERLASMTPEQVQKLGADYYRAYQMVKEALPWLTERMDTLLGRLKDGRIEEAREHLAREMASQYAETSASAQEEVGRDNPVERYTVGGAPINVGKYRACVGCTCEDPCADGSCEGCVSCECNSSGHNHV